MSASTDAKPAGLTGESHAEIYERLPRNSPLKPGQLSDEQLEAYFNNGFIVVKDFFTPEELDPLRNTISELVDKLANKLYNAGKIKSKYEELELHNRLTMLERDFPGANIILHKIEGIPETFMKIAEHPRMLNLLEDFIGPDIAFHPVWNLRTKTPKNDATVVPWHQDSAYMDKESYKTQVMTAWIPLVNASRKNGTMEMMRYSHKRARVAKHSCCAGPTWYVMLEDEDMERDLGCDVKNDAFVLDVPYGSFILFNNFTAHRSLSNTSDEIRWSVDFRWQKAGAPAGLFGLKHSVPLRLSSDENHKADWAGFNAVKRNTAQLNSMQMENTEFSTVISGPWMKSWPIVHENRHTNAFIDDESTWDPNMVHG